MPTFIDLTEQQELSDVTIRLTKDQLEYLLIATANDIIVKSDNARKEGMSLDPSFVAFNKRIQSKLAQAYKSLTK